MRDTWLGARSGRISTTTRPLVVSNTILWSSLMVLLRSAVLAVVDEPGPDRAAGNGRARTAGQPERRAAVQRVDDGALIGRPDLVRQRRGRIGKARLSHDLACAVEAEADGDLRAGSRLFHGRRYPAGLERGEQLLDRIQRSRRRAGRRPVLDRLGRCRRRQDRRGGQREAENARRHRASAATCMRTMRSGFCTAPFWDGDPFLILSTASMPDTTSPTTVYWLFRLGVSPNMMKNWLL